LLKLLRVPASLIALVGQGRVSLRATALALFDLFFIVGGCFVSRPLRLWFDGFFALNLKDFFFERFKPLLYRII
jgi:hypothetical protein